MAGVNGSPTCQLPLPIAGLTATTAISALPSLAADNDDDDNDDDNDNDNDADNANILINKHENDEIHDDVALSSASGSTPTVSTTSAIKATKTSGNYVDSAVRPLIFRCIIYNLSIIEIGGFYTSLLSNKTIYK